MKLLANCMFLLRLCVQVSHEIINKTLLNCIYRMSITKSTSCFTFAGHSQPLCAPLYHLLSAPTVVRRVLHFNIQTQGESSRTSRSRALPRLFVWRLWTTVDSELGHLFNSNLKFLFVRIVKWNLFLLRHLSNGQWTTFWHNHKFTWHLKNHEVYLSSFLPCKFCTVLFIFLAFVIAKYTHSNV